MPYVRKKIVEERAQPAVLTWQMLVKGFIKIFQELTKAQEMLVAQLGKQEESMNFLQDNSDNPQNQASALEAYEKNSHMLIESIEVFALLCSSFKTTKASYIAYLKSQMKVAQAIVPSIVPETSESYIAINIWSSLAKQKKPLLSIECDDRGKKWGRILLFVQSVCGELVGKYTLKKISGQPVETQQDTQILPGEYALEPDAGGSTLAVQGPRISIRPSGSLSGNSSILGSPERLGKRARRDSEQDLVQADTHAGEKSNETGLASETDAVVKNTVIKNKRLGSFMTALNKRDNHCVITGDYTTVEASHILAHAWWNDHIHRRESLPQEIVDVVQVLPDKVDDVRNGLLLRRDLATAFDDGHISLELQANHYRVIAVTPKCEAYDGLLLDENTRIRCDGTNWWASNCPNPKLVAFHLRNSVFKHMVASGSDDESEYADDECFSPELNFDEAGAVNADAADHLDNLVTPTTADKLIERHCGWG
jgi:hypothetical protein